MSSIDPRFLQIHTLTAYPGTLLNRDDAGMAKRIPVGGSLRVRVSSQCLKRHWRRAEDENALSEIEPGLAVRSREIFPRQVRPALLARGLDAERVEAVLAQTLVSLLGESDKGKANKVKKTAAGDEEDPLKTKQVIVLGRPEILHIIETSAELVQGASSAEEAKKNTEAYYKSHKDNTAAFRSIATAGVDAAMFGRMVTSDILSRGDAAIHVAHAFTVNTDASEPDYFSAMDDLAQESGELGSGHINSTELTSGLFYGYVVVDLPLLVSNLTGCDRKEWKSVDRDQAAEVTRRLVHLIATVSPGAKLGSTAPYSWADLMLIESGSRQPRSLAGAFDKAIKGGAGGLRVPAIKALSDHLGRMDRAYGAKEERAFFSILPDRAFDGARDVGGLDALADWAAATARGVA